MAKKTNTPNLLLVEMKPFSFPRYTEESNLEEYKAAVKAKYKSIIDVFVKKISDKQMMITYQFDV